MIGLEDYKTNFGFGDEAAADLIKAIQAGQITGRDTTGLPLTAEPLKVESLQHTLKSLEYRTQDIKLFNMIPKVTEYNTVAEYLQMASYGNLKTGFFYPEGALSNVNDSTYIRRSQNVKFMQVTGEVTLQAQMTRSYIDVYQKEIENKAMLLARVADTFLTHGDADVVPYEFNSLYKQHANIGGNSTYTYGSFEAYYNDNVVIDMRGKSVKQANIEDGAVRADANFGYVSSFCSTTSIISTISKDYYNTQRILLGGAFNGDSNSVIKKISTTIGDVNLVSDKFMARNPFKTSASAADGAQAPAAPSISNVALVTDTKSKFASTDPGGFNNVFYAVAAKNSQGESPLAIFATPVLTASGKSVDITFTSGNGTYAETGYVIYRTSPTSASSATGLNFFPIFQVSTTDLTNGYNGASAGSIRDCGYFLPDCEEAMMIDFEIDVLAFHQLAPLSKIDLAVLALGRRFITFMWGTPILYTPRKMIRFINCSKTYTA